MPSVLNGLAILKMYNKTSKEILLTGLYKKNYEVKDLGITLPEAYINMAKAFLHDKDFDGTPSEKLAMYFYGVVEYGE